MNHEIEIFTGISSRVHDNARCRVVRIRDMPHRMQKALRYWLACRCGGREGNIFRIHGDRSHVALAGNVLTFLKSINVKVDIVSDFPLDQGKWSKYRFAE